MSCLPLTIPAIPHFRILPLHSYFYDSFFNGQLHLMRPASPLSYHLCLPYELSNKRILDTTPFHLLLALVEVLEISDTELTTSDVVPTFDRTF